MPSLNLRKTPIYSSRKPLRAKDRKQEMINDGRWQAMTPAEQAGIMRQMTQGHMTLDEIGKMAADALTSRPWCCRT